MSGRRWHHSLLAGLVVASVGAVGGFGCAGASPPPELLDARSEFERLAAGPEARMAPDAIEEARLALEQAEESFEKHGDDTEARTRAYVALRRVQMAQVLAQTERERQRAAEARVVQDALARVLAGDQARELGAGSGDETASDEMARVQAEARRRDARERLEAVATLEEDEQGVVVVIPSDDLFPPTESDLVPPAFERLQRVVAWLAGMPARPVVVAAHTDARGVEAYNQDLSQRRADAVRMYLVTRGVDASRITAVGQGERRPVSGNDTIDGRKANRRVEIRLVAPGAGIDG